MPKITAILEELCESPGIEACVLSDVESGMAIHHCGDWPEIERIGEAAVEFWRVQQRLNGYFTSLGSLNAMAYFFKKHLVSLFPCETDPPVVLICVSRKNNVDWQLCRQAVVKLHKALAKEPR